MFHMLGGNCGESSEIISTAPEIIPVQMRKGCMKENDFVTFFKSPPACFNYSIAFLHSFLAVGAPLLVRERFSNEANKY